MKRLLLLLALFPCFGFGQVTVGSKEFTESFVLGEIAVGVLERAGVEATHKQGMGGTLILWQALTSGGVDAYPEYTGTIKDEILKAKGPMTPEQMREALRERGIGMTGELGFNNTYALVLPKKRAEELGIAKISDLKNHPQLKAGPTLEFLGRNDGWKPLLERYGIRLGDVRGMKHPIGYRALQSGEIDLKDAYSTDAAIATNDLAVLEDDLQFFPQYKAVFLYRLDLDPKAVAALESLEGKIDEPTMTRLNAEAEETKDYVAVARGFLDSQPVQRRERNVWAEVLGYTGQHLYLVGASLLLAILVGLPLGIAASRRSVLSSGILSLTGLLQTVPSLALFAILVPLLGTEPRTAILALFLYSLLPIVRNTAAGLGAIPLPLQESAIALGLNGSARLFKVMLPMAMPTILAGVKTSAVINVGTAAIAAFIGAGGLGQPIQTGIALSDNELIIKGAIASAVLALLVQFGFDLLERVIVPRGLRISSSR